MSWIVCGAVDSIHLILDRKFNVTRNHKLILLQPIYICMRIVYGEEHRTLIQRSSSCRSQKQKRISVISLYITHHIIKDAMRHSDHTLFSLHPRRRRPRNLPRYTPARTIYTSTTKLQRKLILHCVCVVSHIPYITFWRQRLYILFFIYAIIYGEYIASHPILYPCWLIYIL